MEITPSMRPIATSGRTSIVRRAYLLAEVVKVQMKAIGYFGSPWPKHYSLPFSTEVDIDKTRSSEKADILPHSTPT
jgi:hypothetical protein